MQVLFGIDAKKLIKVVLLVIRYCHLSVYCVLYISQPTPKLLLDRQLLLLTLNVICRINLWIATTDFQILGKIYHFYFCYTYLLLKQIDYLRALQFSLQAANEYRRLDQEFKVRQAIIGYLLLRVVYVVQRFILFLVKKNRYGLGKSFQMKIKLPLNDILAPNY